jgi:hypothetical protein
MAFPFPRFRGASAFPGFDYTTNSYHANHLFVKFRLNILKDGCIGKEKGALRNSVF